MYTYLNVKSLYPATVPYVGDADVPAEASEHDVFNVVHVFFYLLDFGVTSADCPLYFLDLWLPNRLVKFIELVRNISVK